MLFAALASVACRLFFNERSAVRNLLACGVLVDACRSALTVDIGVSLAKEGENYI
jgi:hypothetical protein|tara:strand:+ start:456 stop:620 length:165 start_codon:yes stop_codon:yes gene_type:complete